VRSLREDAMQLVVTVKLDDEAEPLWHLIEGARKVLSEQNVKVLEAPRGLDYGYPFPVVTVSDGPEHVRHFGSEAVAVLRSMSEK